MNDFFNTTGRVKQLQLTAEDWLGTPFIARASIKHAGADCVGLVAGIYVEVGVLKKFEPTKYSMDEGQHLANSKVLGWFNGRPEFRQLEDHNEAKPGDTLCFHLGRVEHHTGLMLEGGKFIHALPKRFAMISDMRESYYSGRITAVFRPVNLQLSTSNQQPT